MMADQLPLIKWFNYKIIAKFICNNMKHKCKMLPLHSGIAQWETFNKVTKIKIKKIFCCQLTGSVQTTSTTTLMIQQRKEKKKNRKTHQFRGLQGERGGIQPLD